MDRLKQLEAFVAVAQQGGFKAAARHLNLSPPSVTRLVNDLEERLGVGLFTRTTRRVSLTDAGQRLLPDAQRALAELDDIEARAAGAEEEPVGRLSLTAPVLFGHRYVAPVLFDYLAQHPNVTARTLLVDRVVNLLDEGMDVAVRIGNLPDSSLRAVRVGAVRRVTAASPAYLGIAGPPQTVRDLARHRTVLTTETEGKMTWDFQAAGHRQTVSVDPFLRCNTNEAAIAAAVAGQGITRVLSYQVTEELAAGALVELLPDAEDRRLPIHLVHAEGRLASAKVRTFIDYAAKALRQQAKRLEAA